MQRRSAGIGLDAGEHRAVRTRAGVRAIMGIRLPSLANGPLPLEPTAFFERIGELVASGTLAQGYVRCDFGASDGFVFLLQGKTHCAGELCEDRFAAHPIAELFERLPHARSASYFATDLPLFLCTSVMFRKAPAAQVPLSLVDAETLLRSVRETEKDAVLVLRRGDDRNLVFCRNGELAALYAVDESFPEEGAIADRIIEYVLGDPSAAETTLDIYDEIRLSPTADAGKSPEEYRTRTRSERTARGPAPSVVVRLGGHVAFQFFVTRDEVTIGRGEPNDLALDNLSVSRKHAIMRKRGEALMLEDLGSENGLVVRGRRMKHVELRPGDEVKIGKYTLAYPRYATSVAESRGVHAPSPYAALEATVSDKVRAAIEHQGQSHEIKGIIFNIGSAKKAHLRVSGVLIAPIHVQLSIAADGGHQVAHIAGQRPLRVNGKRVKSSPLKDGDEFTIGSHIFWYRSATD
jgi:FHA domain-containing protein